MLDEDAFHSSCLPLHIVCQVELKDTNNLFYLAHRLVDANPKSAVRAHGMPHIPYSKRGAPDVRSPPLTRGAGVLVCSGLLLPSDPQG